MSKIRYLIAAVLICYCCLSVAEDNEGHTLTINVIGAIPNTGDAIFSLFTEENYLADPTANKTLPVNEQGGARLILENLASGTYAVSVIYDKNRNGELDTGLFGIPTEKIGMSNNAKGRFGPPSFAKSSFVLSESKALDIVLSKAKK